MPVAQNSKPSRLGEISRLKLSGFLATRLIRVPLTWARDHVAKPFSWSPRREPWTRTQSETLQLSLRQGGPAWARLAGFRVCSRTQFAKSKPKPHSIITKRKKNVKQHSKACCITIWTTPTSGFHLHYPFNSKTLITHISVKRLCTQMSSQPIHNPNT